MGPITSAPRCDTDWVALLTHPGQRCVAARTPALTFDRVIWRAERHLLWGFGKKPSESPGATPEGPSGDAEQGRCVLLWKPLSCHFPLFSVLFWF
jgi:hypothetical protein